MRLLSPPQGFNFDTIYGMIFLIFLPPALVLNLSGNFWYFGDFSYVSTKERKLRFTCEEINYVVQTMISNYNG